MVSPFQNYACIADTRLIIYDELEFFGCIRREEHIQDVQYNK